MFPLLSLWTELFFWALAIGLTALLVVKWQTLASKRVRNIFFRIGSILLVQILFISAAGLTLNRSGEFYSSWYDLVGIHASISKSAISTSAISGITEQDLRKSKTLSGGSLVINKIITGENSGVTAKVFVVLPPLIAKELKVNPDFAQVKEDYKVAELFPGYPGVPETWIGALKGISALEKLENQNQIAQTIAIIPTINVVPGEDTECMNYRGGPQVETWLTQDVRVFAQRYIGIDSRPWATFGYSTGGWCATELAIRHQDLYGAAISLAGYFSPSYAFGATPTERAFLRNEYDLHRILSLGNNSLKLLVIASKADRFSYASTQSFIQADSSLISIKFDEIPSGGHNLAVWRPYVTAGFQWLKLSGF